MKRKIATIILALTLTLFSTTDALALVTSTVDFNSTSDLTDKLTDDGTPVFTNLADSGINNTGSVNVPIPSNDIWTTKQAYSVTGAAGSVYTFSAYFKVAVNSGYGNLGFTSSPNNTADSIGQPSEGLGANFHGGGGAFVNNGSQTTLSWPPDLVLGNWYWMTFEVTTKGSDTFDLKLQIWNTDATGVIGTMKTEKTLNDVVNTDLGSATTIYAFFSAAGSRMDKIDDFVVTLENATFVEEGEPVVVSDVAVVNITENSADFGGEVIDENGSPVGDKGVCWSTSPNPTRSDTCTADGAGLGAFDSSMTGLSGNTTYYVRSYATNANGTSYGLETSFTTSAPVSDSDGLDDTVEANGPNGGDANDDGTADNLQSNVGSISSSVSSEYVVLETSNDCSSIDTMNISSEANLGEDDVYTYPEGLLGFTLSGCSVGSTATITQYYYGVENTDNLIVRKFNPNTNSYQNIDSATVEIVTIDGQQVVKVTYTITDGGSLDMDNTANGEITDPAGLALAALADTGDSLLPSTAIISLIFMAMIFRRTMSQIKTKKS